MPTDALRVMSMPFAGRPAGDRSPLFLFLFRPPLPAALRPSVFHDRHRGGAPQRRPVLLPFRASSAGCPLLPLILAVDSLLLFFRWCCGGRRRL